LRDARSGWNVSGEQEAGGLDRPAERIEHEAEHFQSDDAQKRFIAPLTKNHRSVPVPLR